MAYQCIPISHHPHMPYAVLGVETGSVTQLSRVPTRASTHPRVVSPPSHEHNWALVTSQHQCVGCGRFDFYLCSGCLQIWCPGCAAGGQPPSYGPAIPGPWWSTEKSVGTCSRCDEDTQVAVSSEPAVQSSKQDGWLPSGKMRAQAERNKELMATAEEKRRKTSKPPYVWPVVQKGMRPAQAVIQARASIKANTDRLMASQLALAETMKAAADVKRKLNFEQMEIPELPDGDLEHSGLYEAPHVADASRGRVLGTDGQPIYWPWESEHNRVQNRAAPFKSTRQLRKRHQLDDLVELGLNYASKDGNRGRTHVGVRAWFSFCTDIMGVPADRPMDPMSTPLWEKLEDEWLAMRFVCALVQDKGLTVNSASQYFSSANAWHGREHGVKLAGGLKLERLPAMLKGLRRVIGEAPKKLRRGVAPRALRRAMDLLLDPNDPAHANLRAALATAFLGMLRASEFTTPNGKVDEDHTLMVSDLVDLTDARMVLMMAPCKNMHHLKGKTCPLVIGAGGDFIDAVAEVRNRLRVDPVAPGAEASTPLFRDPKTNSPLRYDFVNNLVKKLMRAVGEKEGDFSSHSLRIGGATAHFTAGANETVIRTMGRWSSDIYRLYVRACFEQCCEWTRKAGSTEVSDLSGEFDEVDSY